MNSPAIVWTIRALAYVWLGLVGVTSFDPEVYADPEMGIALTIVVAAFLCLPAVCILKFFKNEKKVEEEVDIPS